MRRGKFVFSEVSLEFKGLHDADADGRVIQCDQCDDADTMNDDGWVTGEKNGLTGKCGLTSTLKCCS